jgi:hypothetical protein
MLKEYQSKSGMMASKRSLYRTRAPSDIFKAGVLAAAVRQQQGWPRCGSTFFFSLQFFLQR